MTRFRLAAPFAALMLLAVPAHADEPPGAAASRCTGPERVNPNSNSPCDWYAVAKAYYKGQGVRQDMAESARWMKRAADAGHRTAQFNYAVMMEGDEPLKSRNKVEAFRYMQMAAEQGDAEAMSSTGDNYKLAYGTAENKPLAFRWYQRAIQAGSAEAATRAGTMLRQGNGVPKNLAEALRYYRFAAERGDASGQFYLGEHYRMGEGLPFDLPQARFWLGKSAAQGNKFAKGSLDFIASVDRRAAAGEFNAPRRA